MPAPNEITVPQLNRLIGTPECPRIVDVCIDPDFDDDPFFIPTSVRHSHQDAPGLMHQNSVQKTVIVCQKGKKLSQGLAAWLRSAGQSAEYLAGGKQAWRAAEDTACLPADRLPAPIHGSTLWVTRQRPKLDRVACPWLIRRFIDPAARFLFVGSAEVLDVAERFGATAFDVEGAPFAHQGDRCSFDAILAAFGLNTPALNRMADIIRAADTGHSERVPQSAGLLALSIGLSRQYRDDTAQLEAGMSLYDALYRWARDGYEETHGAPGTH